MKKFNTIKSSRLALVAGLLLGTFVSTLHAEEPAWTGKKSSFHAFDMYDFRVDDLKCRVVVPKKGAEGKPWIWRARFFGHQPQADIALLEKGYHVVYCDVGGLFGSPEAVARWDAFYDYLTKKHGFAKKTTLEGMSRGGLIIFNWAAKNPEKVHSIYGDAPVLDFKSWPGVNDAILSNYGLTKEEAQSYKGNPVDNLKPLVDAGVAVLLVVGDADTVVPIAQNASVVEKRYKELGGHIVMIHKPGVGHHPHSLKDPKPIVDFVLKHAK